MTSDEIVRANDASTVTTEPAPPETPAPTSVLAELGIRPGDMFPESPPGQGDMRNMAAREPVDHRPPWLYRRTEELTVEEVRKLFIPTPHETLRRLLIFIEQTVGTDRDKRRGAGAVGAVATPKKRGRLQQLLDRAAARVGYVPADVSEYLVACARTEGEALSRVSTIDGRVELALEVHAKARSLLAGLFPQVDAQTREGKNHRGHRMVAVWADPLNPDPTEEPEW